MEEPKIMTVAETIEELDFAMRHGFDFTKHNFAQLLNENEVREVCKKLNINAELKPTFMEKDSFGKSRAYYVLSFYQFGEYSNKNIASYFSANIITSDDGWVVSPEEEKEAE
jgi:hypothetical protein